MTKTTEYLEAFKQQAPAWFAKATFVREYFEFFRTFFKRENLEKAEWPDVQKIGSHLHCFQSMAMAQRNALGRPNHPIEHYRKSFTYLAHGPGEPAERIRRFCNDAEYRLEYFGKSAISELVGYLFPEQFMFVNARDVFAAGLLGISVEKQVSDDLVGELEAFSKATRQVAKQYEEIVGRQTDLPLNLEVDQFFSWLFENKQKENVSGKRYWLFQANPGYFDLTGALKAGALHTWQVNKHKQHIKPGDQFVIWQSGKNSGAYAFATVTTPVGTLEENKDEAAFRVGGTSDGKPFTGVELRVDRNFSETPILKELIKRDKQLKDAPIGRQGTNFALTEKQFRAFESLAPTSGQRRFWLYAPGPQAKYWDECREKGIMVLGSGSLPDLRSFKSQKDIEKAIKKEKQSKGRPTNDARGYWEFTNTLKPGDVVIAKRGRREYLGFGIVDGPYDRDEARPGYKNFRRISWIKSGSWPAEDHKIILKALTDITKYPDYVRDLCQRIGIATEDLPVPALQSPKILPALNIILYGPPGTGKTHQLRNHYMEMFTDRQAVLGVEERASGLVKDLAWWEVVALALLDTKDKKCSVAQILEHPLVRARLKLSSNKNPRAILWASLQSHTKMDCPNVKYATRTDPLLFSKDEASLWSVDTQIVETEVPELRPILQAFHNPPKEAPGVSRWKFTTFHQSFSYEDFVEGIKPQMEDRDDGQLQLAYEVRPGIFKVICAEAEANPSKPYALFIDEINRGNVASIFGELITLIEEDKRLGEANALTPELPYSRKPFGVPPNLHIIGTMNTADRSVEALDTALRRRFTFIEMRPDPKLITYPPSLKVDLQTLLAVINDRIEQLLDHDHCIGHAYFMGITDLAALRSVFANKIIPLLREYFYGNPAKVGMVLGERFVSRKAAKAPFAAGSWGADDFDEKEVFTFADTSKLNEEDFQSIYV